MSFVVGHSQVKYLSEYLSEDSYTVVSYPGYRVSKFLYEDVIFEVSPFFSTSILVVGANDIGSKSPASIVKDVEDLCLAIRQSSPCTTVLVSEVLPRAQNMFPGHDLSPAFLKEWNYDAGAVNRLLGELSRRVPWVDLIRHPEFHTMFGANRQLLSKDGLHLSYEGTAVLASNIMSSVTRVSEVRSVQTVAVPISTESTPTSVLSGPKRYSDVAATHCPTLRPATRHTMTQQPVSHTTRTARQPVNRSEPPAHHPVNRFEPPARARQPVNRSEPPAHHPVNRFEPPARARQPVNCSKPPTQQPVSRSTRTARQPVNRSESLAHQLVNCTKPSAQLSGNRPAPPARQHVDRSKHEPARQRNTTESDKDLDDTVRWIEDPSEIPGNRNSQSGGGGVSVVFSNQKMPLSASAVECILKNCESSDECRISTTMPTEINDGDIFVVDKSALPNQGDIRIDRYMWINDGRKKIPHKKPTLSKSFFKIKLPGKVHSKAFQKFIYEDLDQCNFAVIHYIGDPTIYKPLCHGNSKKNSDIYVRTNKSVIEEIKSRADDITVSANLIEKQLKCRAEKGTDLGVKTSRNLTQVKNHLYKTRRDKRYGNDEIYNLCEISYELENFNKQIDVYPSLVCVSGLDEILKEFNELLVFDSGQPFKMVYDTTYKMGQLFVSVLSYQHILFKDNRIIPVAFMMHERRDAKFHERFFNVLKEHIPNFKKSNFPIVCDREAGIRLAIQNSLPNIPIIHCWNHINTDIKVWLKKTNAKQDDLTVYTNDVKELMRHCSEEEYVDAKQVAEQKWSEEFRKYFDKHVEPTIINHSGRWILEKHNIYDPYSGTTQNAAESVNNMIRSIQHRKELPVELICLNLLMAQKSVYADIQCGRAGFGNYKLKPEFEYARLDPEDIRVPNLSGTPDEILRRAKEQFENFQKVSINENCNNNTSEQLESESTTGHVEESNVGEVKHTMMDIVNDKNVTLLDDKDESEKKGAEKNITQKALALHVIENDKIRMVPSMKTFVVEGIHGSKRLVTLTPKETCSCPSTGQCYHILAVKMSLNIDGICDRPAVKNLTQLRKNSKPRVAKKTGQKKPKKADFEINAAPDSLLMTPSSCKKPTISTPNSTQRTPSSSSKKRKLSESKNLTSRKKIKFDPNLSSIAEDVLIEENELDISDHLVHESIDTDLPTTEENIQDLINISDVRLSHNTSSIDTSAIADNEGWLNDTIINRTHSILQSQFPSVNGMQDTLLAPEFNDRTGTWDIFKQLTQQAPPAVQIHYNGHHHWVTSYQKSVNGSVILLDSLKSAKSLNSSISIQLTQIYSNNKDRLKVEIPDVQRQNNSNDCGVFAIANLCELLCTKFDIDVSQIRFETSKMRTHLLQCIEQNAFTPFPKVKKMPKMPCKETKIQTVKIFCTCKLPDIVGDQVQCDNKFCKIKWYHKKCVDYVETVRGQKWLCRSCSW